MILYYHPSVVKPFCQVYLIMNFTSHLKAMISINGPLPLDQFMSVAIQHYYATQQPFGEQGDFITSPEISQMFGEIIGIWLANKWSNMGAPPFYLIEIGGGRGLMMADILRSIRNISSITEALLHLFMVEQSPKLIVQQQHALEKYQAKTSWHLTLLEVESLLQEKYVEGEPALFIINNEFFDALPMKQYIRDHQGAREVCVGIAEGELVFAHSSPLPGDFPLLEGQVLEVSPQRINYAGRIATVLKRYSKHAGLIVDYGYTVRLYVNTLQAIHKHQHVDVLQTAGQADITSLVDFTSLIEVMTRHGIVSKCWPQREFLQHYGINIRAQQLIKNGAAPSVILQQLERLTSPEAMGLLFKVLELG